jgi:hypothetical protein
MSDLHRGETPNMAMQRRVRNRTNCDRKIKLEQKSTLFVSQGVDRNCPVSRVFGIFESEEKIRKPKIQAARGLSPVPAKFSACYSA